MAKFGKKQTKAARVQKYSATLAAHPDATTNHEGGLAFNYADAKMELFTLVMSCLFNEPKFYGKTGTTENRIIELVQKLAPTDAEFLLRLAKYARKEGNLRSVPVALLVETALAIRLQNKNLDKKARTALTFSVRPFVRQIVSRADEITEVLSYYAAKFGDVSKLPLALKRGLADSFKNFSTYQLLKYNRDGEVSMGDAVNVLHPHGKTKESYAKEERYLFKHISGKNLIGKDKDNRVSIEEDIKAVVGKTDSKQSVLTKKVIDAEVIEAVSKGDITWEVFISHFGSNTQSWTAIAPNMPYMATLRNLRNFLENGVHEETLKKVAAKLSDKNAVLKSKQFPYRFFSAYRELDRSGVRVPNYLVKALSDALEISVQNLPKLGGVSFVASDNSGSMHSPLSAKSSVEKIEVAAMMSAIAYGFSDDAIVGAFGESFKFVTLNPNDSVLTNMQKIRNANVGHSTNAYLAIKALTDKKTKVDRIFIFSDMQCYDSRSGGGMGYYYGSSGSLAAELKQYRKTVNPNVKVYSFDLAGYGTAQFPSDDSNVVTLAGYSEKVFKFMEIFEAKDANILDVIAKY